jgi:hypothetical protein
MRMITTPCRLALIAVAAITLTAGCTSRTDSAAEQRSATPTAAPVTASATTSATKPAAAVKLDDLLSAPVPSLCQHEPGNLVNGGLPGQDPRSGLVRIARSSYPSGDYRVAFGDLTGDGVDDGALVTDCNAGGVPWPATVQLYSAGPTLLGGVDLSDLTKGGRETVTGLSIADGVVHVSWLTQGPNDGACCGTVLMAGDLRWDGSKVVAENVKQTN